ncbi:MAG: CDP-alcohol phosphatidyltransferase family protein [Clostridia bacterium]|nr:CDP-alcohol phosphatidyltransferase family protein [Clostridia bacterium]
MNIHFKRLANIITVTRMIASGIMLFFPDWSFEFFCFYTYCGISDMLDGFIARKSGGGSAKGALLDSAADVVFIAAAGIKLLPGIIEAVPWTVTGIIIVAAIKISGYGVGAVRFKRFISFHTALNKAAGAALFFLPYLAPFMDLGILCLIACAISVLAAIEEFLITIFASSYEPDTKTICQPQKYNGHNLHK